MSIDSVNGKTTVNIGSSSISEVRRFLEANDHEGSGLSLTITVEEGEVYRVLHLLENM